MTSNIDSVNACSILRVERLFFSHRDVSRCFFRLFIFLHFASHQTSDTYQHHMDHAANQLLPWRRRWASTVSTNTTSFHTFWWMCSVCVWCLAVFSVSLSLPRLLPQFFFFPFLIWEKNENIFINKLSVCSVLRVCWDKISEENDDDIHFEYLYCRSLCALTVSWRRGHGFFPS